MTFKYLVKIHQNFVDLQHFVLKFDFLSGHDILLAGIINHRFQKYLSPILVHVGHLMYILRLSLEL